MSFATARIPIGSGSVASGSIAPQQVGWPHMASGAVRSGDLGITAGIPTGATFLSDQFAWGPPSSPAGSITSGAVQGFFGTAPDITSGTVGVFDLGSGAVIAGRVGSGAIVSGNIASGRIGSFHFAAGGVGTVNIASGQVGQFHTSSGAVKSGHISSGAVTGSVGGGAFNIISGSLGPHDFASGGSVSSTNIASGQVGQFAISSGAVVSGDLGITGGGAPNGNLLLRDDFTWQDINTVSSGSAVSSGAVLSGNIASGQVNAGNSFTRTFSSGAEITYANALTFDWPYPASTDPIITAELISGIRCVRVNSSGQIQIAMAAVSGRMPATGVLFSNIQSGQQLENTLSGAIGIGPVIRYGLVKGFSSEIGSGVCISGRMGRSLWVGASGQIVTISGGGPTIGVGATNSGAWGQFIGISAASGAVLIDIVPSLLFSGAAAITTDPRTWPV